MSVPENSERLLELESIHVAYVKKEILRGLSLSVNRGEIVALLGGNGSGKSTVLKATAGILQPISGKIVFRGEDISTMPVHTRQKAGIGFLVQGGKVFPNLTVAENFEIAQRHRRTTGDAPAIAALGYVFPDLQRYRDARAGLLSGGQRQMLAIEMVLVQQPVLSLMDEPTGGLAEDLALAVIDALHNYVLYNRSGLLLVEQNVTLARRWATRVLELSDGTVASLEANQTEDKA